MRVIEIIPVIITILVHASTLIWAQTPTVTFDHLFHTGAYSQSIAEDQEGFIWVGTDAGIVRYDGYEQRVYKAGSSGLSASGAPVVFVDSEGLIWVGTAGGGLNVYDKRTDTFTAYQHDPDDPQSESHL